MSLRIPQIKNQICTFPELIEDKVENKPHAARFFTYLANGLELELYRKSHIGTPPYSRRTLVAVIMYAMYRGIFSTIEIIKFAEDSIGVHWILSGMKMPSYKTVERTINLLLNELDNIFMQILAICEKLSLIGKKRIYIDGTKIKANASKHKAMSYGYLKKKIEKSKNEITSLYSELKNILGCFEDLSEQELKEMIDEESKKVFDILKKNHQSQLEIREEQVFNIDLDKEATSSELDCNLINEESRILRNSSQEKYDETLETLVNVAHISKKMDRMETAKVELERKWAIENGDKKIPDKKQINFTDSDSCIMVTKHQGVQQCYNHFAFVDDKANIILGTHTSNNSSDQLGLIPTIENTEKLYGSLTGFQLGGDAGFFSAANFRFTAGKGIDFYASFPEAQSAYAKDKFKYELSSDSYICPEENILTMNKQSEDGNIRQYSNEKACADCKNRSNCTKAKDGIRRIERDMENDEIREAAKEKARSEVGKEILRLRKSIPEPVWGNIKTQNGLTQMHYRGMDKSTIEFRLHSMIHNIRKIFKVYLKSKTYQQIVHRAESDNKQSA